MDESADDDRVEDVAVALLFPLPLPLPLPLPGGAVTTWNDNPPNSNNFCSNPFSAVSCCEVLVSVMKNNTIYSDTEFNQSVVIRRAPEQDQRERAIASERRSVCVCVCVCVGDMYRRWPDAVRVRASNF